MVAKSRKPKGGGDRPFRIRLNEFEADDERPPLDLSFWVGRKLLGRSEIAEDGQVKIDQRLLAAAETVRLGPKEADLDCLSEVGLNLRRDVFAKSLEAGVLDVARQRWIAWRLNTHCATGRVRVCRRSRWWFDDLTVLAARPIAQPVSRASLTTSSAIASRAVEAPVVRRASPFSSIDELIAWPTICKPICDGVVEVYRRICCCDPWIVYDPRLEELIPQLEDLVDEIPDPIPDPWPGPFPDPRPTPRPGPRPGPGPDPVPIDLGPFFKEGALDEMALRAGEDLAAIRSLPAEQVPEYINARPYLFCRSYSCGAPVKVAEGNLTVDGRFNICWREFPIFLRLGCHREYAYIVKQPFGPFMITVYNGVAANDWYDLDDDPTLTTYSPWAYGCRVNPAGNFVFLNAIADTGSHELITPDADGALSVAPPAQASGLVFPNAGTAPSGVTERNWGGTLKLNYTISEGMQDVGAKYYRIGVTEADAFGNAVGGTDYLTAGLSWNKAVPDGGGGVDIVPVTLGPNTVGGQTGLYLIPYDTNPTTEWLDGQYHGFLDTNDARWSDPTKRHLVTIEIFDNAGQRLRPSGTPASGLGGAETDAAFTFRRRFQETGATDNVPFGALTHLFWWDNRPVYAKIEDLRKDGLQFNDECLFFEGSAGSTFSVGYRAFHENELFQYRHRITWKRGLSGGTGVLQPYTSTNAGGPPLAAPVGISGSNTYAQMLDTATNPSRTKCAFTIFLTIQNKLTDGDDWGFLQANDSAAVAIEITS